MKRIKVIILIGLIFILSVINYVWADYNELTDEETLGKAFEASGAEPLQLNVNATGIILDHFSKSEDLVKMGLELKDELGICGDRLDYNQAQDLKEDDLSTAYMTELSQTDHIRQYTLWGRDDNHRAVTVILSSYQDPLSNKGETTLVIDVVQDEAIDNLPELTMTLREIFRKFNANTKIATCIIGTYNAQLKEYDKSQVISNILKITRSKRIEGMEEKSLISISAYSPMIDRYIYTDNRKMNLNVAIRYNDYENKTYIWMGTPIIAVGY